MQSQVIHGDCLEVLKTLEDNSVDAICTDPPYGMGVVKDIAGLLYAWLGDEDDSKYLGSSGFMGKEWDAGVPGPRYWREALRVLKPGGHLLAFSSTRTYDLLVIALRIAGFECRDQIDWIYGSGFPKSLNVSAAIDKHLKADREVIGQRVFADGTKGHATNKMHEGYQRPCYDNPDNLVKYDTKPATDLAKKYDGYGSALKPSHEPICLARKPLAEKSIAANVLTWGTGAINIDATRIGNDIMTEGRMSQRAGGILNCNGRDVKHGNWKQKPNDTPDQHAGRFPSNTLFSHSIWCIPCGEKRVHSGSNNPRHNHAGKQGYHGNTHDFVTSGYGDEEGMETVPAYQCVEGCPVRLLDEMSGVRKSGALKPYNTNTGNFGSGYVAGCRNVEREPSEGGASRYFQSFPPDDMPPFTYVSKASRKERNAGCEALPERDKATAYGDGLNSATKVRTTEQAESGVDRGKTQNGHPTVKPLSLLKYLITMITPPGGIVLDCFSGSGTTGVACIQSGFRYILIEQEQEYIDIIHARLAHAHQAMPVQEAGEYECVPECPVRILGEQSGVGLSGYRANPSTKRNQHQNTTYGKYQNEYTVGERGYDDTGTAARFFQTFPPSLFDEEAIQNEAS